MANEEHLAILKQGVEAWDRWRNKSKEIPDLEGGDLCGVKLKDANLCGANLEKANFYGANLENANLSDANLKHADLIAADLSHANLNQANLSFAELHAADLIDANLSSANLIGAVFTGTDLTGANFESAIVSFTKFAYCDLSKVKGLELVDHWGFSTVGVDTIYLSKGKIPESFLLGCGVPDSFIRYIPSLVGAEEDIQFYSCFISYSSKDEEFAKRLHARMREAQLRVWYAPEDIQGGQKLHEQIETAIRVYDKLLIVLSEASLQSEWVMTELRKARKAERQSGTRKLFPVRLVNFETLRDWECFDADSGKDLAVELREYFIPDFSNWKDHDQFEAAFARLLKDLRAEEHAK
jgi:TIR domain/Pentapeptide repeats (8 copies)